MGNWFPSSLVMAGGTFDSRRRVLIDGVGCLRVEQVDQEKLGGRCVPATLAHETVRQDS